MTFEELRDELLERLAEYDDQTVASNTSASFNDATILKRLKRVYKRLLGRARRKYPRRFTSTTTFTYTAGAESIDLSTSGPPTVDLTNALFHEFIDETQSSYPTTMRILSEGEYRNRFGVMSFLGQGMDDDDWSYGAFVDGGNLYLLPKPNAAVNVKVRYSVAPDLSSITTGNWGSNSPDLFPEEHHEYIAVEAALDFARNAGDDLPGLTAARAELAADFNEWLSEAETPGPRYVHNVD